MRIYLSQYLQIDPAVLAEYGAFDVSVASDLPLFIDPFLLFHSDKREYQELHQSILKYVRFLRDKASQGPLDPGLVASLYRFKEVKQNWLGFTVLGNGGHGLGHNFAVALHTSLGTVLSDFGTEFVTRSSHFEKVGLIRPGVGRDSISDFTTNLIKGYLLEYTQTFAKQHLRPDQCRVFRVRRANFNYDTEAWEDGEYLLPALWDDFVLLTPIDMLTRDETWINHSDMIDSFWRIPMAVTDEELRAQVNNYFYKHLEDRTTKRDRAEAARRTISEFPQLVDYYIRLKEDEGDKAESVSLERVDDIMSVFVTQLKQVVEDLRAKTNFYNVGLSSYEEALARVRGFKDYVEHQDGYKLINRKGKPFAQETEVQLFFGLIWFGSLFDQGHCVVG